MRAKLFIILTAILAVTLISCSKSDDSNGDGGIDAKSFVASGIQGKWKQVSYYHHTYGWTINAVGDIYNFGSDGTLKISFQSGELMYTYNYSYSNGYLLIGGSYYKLTVYDKDYIELSGDRVGIDEWMKLRRQ
jgi:hypothetical protein